MANANQKTHHYNQYVVFSLADEDFGIEISRVREVMKTPDITSMPGMADFIEGIIYLRDRVVPVYDLRSRLGLSKDTRDSKIIIYELDEEHIAGLIVDDVDEILTLAADQLEAVGDKFGDRDVRYIREAGILDERILLILELDQLLSGEEVTSLAEMTEKAKKNIKGQNNN